MSNGEFEQLVAGRIADLHGIIIREFAKNAAEMQSLRSSFAELQRSAVSLLSRHSSSQLESPLQSPLQSPRGDDLPRASSAKNKIPRQFSGAGSSGGVVPRLHLHSGGPLESPPQSSRSESRGAELQGIHSSMQSIRSEVEKVRHAARSMDSWGEELRTIRSDVAALRTNDRAALGEELQRLRADVGALSDRLGHRRRSAGEQPEHDRTERPEHDRKEQPEHDRKERQGQLATPPCSDLSPRQEGSADSAAEFAEADGGQLAAGVNEGHKTVQLHRLRLRDRLRIEMLVQERIGRVSLFLFMSCCFFANLWVYDPIDQMSQVHDVLRSTYGLDTESLAEVKSPEQVLDFVQSFIETTYNHASALVDANTMNSIDLARCFDDNTEDVCRLKYWETPTRRENMSNYADLQELESGTGTGRSREIPIIMDSRLDFPYAQVVPLAPIVWQIRAPRVPCSGFGDVYNHDVLAAGLCSPKETCDADSMTSFVNEIPNSNSTSQIFLTYEEAAFYCYDRSKQATTFLDKSWYPEATLADMQEGRLMSATSIEGNAVFYKFVSDARYLQAPIGGTVVYNKTDPCTACEGWSSPDCTDPIEEGSDHPMWTETADSESSCSGRQAWIENYLNAESKKSTFLTSETSELTIASLAITPQMDGLADITSLVRVVFKFQQSGQVHGEAMITSTSDTDHYKWLPCVIAVMLSASTFAFLTARDMARGRGPAFIARTRRAGAMVCTVDLICAFGCLAHVSLNVALDYSPPHITPELEAAFKQNSQSAYFETFNDILNYTNNLNILKLAGFLIVMAMFMRLVHMLSFHPRLGLIVSVLTECFDDMFHFLVQYVMFLVVLTFLGHWYFGGVNIQYGTYVSSAYTLVRCFLGAFDSEFSENVPDTWYLLFITFYIVVSGILMLNFLLAIIIDAYSTVMMKIREDDSEMNVVMDIWDAIKFIFYGGARSWPRAIDVLEYIQGSVVDGIELEDMPAVTAEELYLKFGRFKSLSDGIDYTNAYARKLVSEGKWLLCEDRDEQTFQQGFYLRKCDNSPIVGLVKVPEESRDGCRSPRSQSKDLHHHLMPIMATRHSHRSEDSHYHALHDRGALHAERYDALHGHFEGVKEQLEECKSREARMLEQMEKMASQLAELMSSVASRPSHHMFDDRRSSV